MTVSFSVFCNFQTFMSIRRPSNCSVPMLCTISSKCQRTRASQAVHSRERFAEDACMAFQAHADSLLNAEFRS